MWVLKSKGQTHYVNHVDFKSIDFSTKETPDNSHTKGSIKCKGYMCINDQNVAVVTADIGVLEDVLSHFLNSNQKG